MASHLVAKVGAALVFHVLDAVEEVFEHFSRAVATGRGAGPVAFSKETRGFFLSGFTQRREADPASVSQDASRGYFCALSLCVEQPQGHCVTLISSHRRCEAVLQGTVPRLASVGQHELTFAVHRETNLLVGHGFTGGWPTRPS